MRPRIESICPEFVDGKKGEKNEGRKEGGIEERREGGRERVRKTKKRWSSLQDPY